MADIRIKKILLIFDKCIDTLCIMALLLVLTIGSYSLWDTNHVVQNASADVYEKYNPKEDVLNFQQLIKINPDTKGWLKIEGTKIDYPLMQGKDNWEYINHDAKGNYNLVGSLFLDYQNTSDFMDFNTIVYGHNMVPEVMFGGIKSFKEANYFEKYQSASLYYGGKAYHVELFAMMEADAYDLIFTANIKAEAQKQEYLDTIKQNARRYREINVTTKDRIILFSTCSNTATNQRDILVGRITDKAYVPKVRDEQKQSQEKVNILSRELKLLLLILFLLLIGMSFWVVKKRKLYEKR